MRTAAFFNYLLDAARSHLSLARLGGERDRKFWLNCAGGVVRKALAEANRMHDRKRAGLCLKILNWLRADLRRLAA